LKEKKTFNEVIEISSYTVFQSLLTGLMLNFVIDKNWQNRK